MSWGGRCGGCVSTGVFPVFGVLFTLISIVATMILCGLTCTVSVDDCVLTIAVSPVNSVWCKPHDGSDPYCATLDPTT